jgi:hypothetical protein
MRAYKLMRLRKNGTLGSLFINRREVYPIGKWMDAEYIPTKGFAKRAGWHCTLRKYAPHLSTKGRVWVEVEVEDFTPYLRPESQGGAWILAQKMRIICICNDIEVVEK